jgi:23S rRNA (guanosine2251-2'-O)-methyltransferase
MAEGAAYWTAGLHAVETALEGGGARVRRVLADRRRRDARLRRVLETAERCGVAVERVDARVIEERVAGVRHQGICAEVLGPAVLDEHDVAERIARSSQPLVLVLDGVQDPHNLGACLRTAAAAGADAVVVPRDRAARLNATVERAAAGAARRVPFATVTNLARALAVLKDAGCWVVGTAGEADTPVHDADLAGGLALVMGGEEKGLRARTRSACDQLVRISLAGPVESLNVSVATGICLFEALRQRQASAQAQAGTRR